MGTDGAQKSLQVEISVLATTGERLKQTDGLRELSAPKYVFLEFRFKKKINLFDMSIGKLCCILPTLVSVFMEHAVYIYGK